jgi:hypothetical protein
VQIDLAYTKERNAIVQAVGIFNDATKPVPHANAMLEDGELGGGSSDAPETAAARRERQLVVLVLRFLASKGYADAADRLAADSGVSLRTVRAPTESN